MIQVNVKQLLRLLTATTTFAAQGRIKKGLQAGQMPHGEALELA